MKTRQRKECFIIGVEGLRAEDVPFSLHYPYEKGELCLSRKGRLCSLSGAADIYFDSRDEAYNFATAQVVKLRDKYGPDVQCVIGEATRFI